MSSVFKETCQILNIKQLNSTVYHHETVGVLENDHKNFGAYLRMQIAHYSNAWSIRLPFWCFTYNTVVHTETKYTPFELSTQTTDYRHISISINSIYTFDKYPLEPKYHLQASSDI